MENKAKDMITIPFEEYKELLIIKGRYEELKSQLTLIPSTANPLSPKITYRGSDGVEISTPASPY